MRACAVSSIRQIKILLYLIQAVGLLFACFDPGQGFFGQVQILEIFQVLLDRFANVKGGRSARLLGQSLQALIGFVG